MFRIPFAVISLIVVHETATPARACEKHGQAMSGTTRIARAVRHYELPKVVLTDQDGRAVGLEAALPRDRDVAVNFIFTTCTTVCPVLSATFRGLHREPGAADVQLVSITIDPEHDRPAVLKAYAQRFDAAQDWRFYTGSVRDVRRVLAAFDALTGDKSNHRPVTLVRRAGAEAWTRLEGFPGAGDLAEQLRAP